MRLILPDFPILNHSTPRDSAEKLLAYSQLEGYRILHYVPFSQNFWIYFNNAYQQISSDELMCLIGHFLANSKREVKGEADLMPFITNMGREREVFHALKNLCSHGISSDPLSKPSWIFTDPNEEMPDPEKTIVFSNGLFHLDMYLKKRPYFSPLTPTFFSANRLNMPFTENASPFPCKWLKFLSQIFSSGDDISLLQKWFGYCLSSMTSFQKFLVIVGEPRSGKGTIARTLQTILGKINCASPSAADLSDRWGGEMILGKKLVTLGDARFGKDKERAKDFILGITGEDELTVQRKFKPPVSVRMPCKIIIISNELPSFDDMGGALTSRMLVLRTCQSFVGRENYNLEVELLEELPSILLWGLQGLNDLLKDGRFNLSETQKSMLEVMDDDADLRDFVREECILSPSFSIEKKVLYYAYENWALKQGGHPLDIRHFSRNLYSVFPVEPSRKESDGIRKRIFKGICLKKAY